MTAPRGPTYVTVDAAVQEQPLGGVEPALPVERTAVDNAWIGMRMTDPAADLATLAASYGAWSLGPVDDPAELASSFQEAVQAAQAGNTAVVHVRTAPQ